MSETVAVEADSVTVFNLSSDDIQTFTCTPRQAVLAAHAQSLGDFNTWDYEQNYRHLLTRGRLTIACGDFCAKERPYHTN
jgi:hypothetical protein